MEMEDALTEFDAPFNRLIVQSAKGRSKTKRNMSVNRESNGY